MIKTEEYKQAECVVNNPKDYHENDLFKALTYTIAYEEGYEQALSLGSVVEPKGKLEMFQNMQYYMEHCQRHGYITPQDWLEKEKHF